MTWFGLLLLAAAIIGATTQAIARHVDRNFTADGERRHGA